MLLMKHVFIKTTMSNKRYRTHYRVIWISLDLTVFSIRMFTREVVQSYINKYIKHSLFPSLCVEDNYMTIVEYKYLPASGPNILFCFDYAHVILYPCYR